MGKRIRWIWVISLAAALAAIGVQGYWLFNQFRYEMCTYADEIAGDMQRLGANGHRTREQDAAAQLRKIRVVNALVQVMPFLRERVFAPELLDVDQCPAPSAESKVLEPGDHEIVRRFILHR